MKTHLQTSASIQTRTSPPKLCISETYDRTLRQHILFVAILNTPNNGEDAALDAAALCSVWAAASSPRNRSSAIL